MIILSCRESGLDCNFMAEGKTEGEGLKIISEHATNVHNLRAEDMYEEEDIISTSPLCQSEGKMTSTYNYEKPY